MSSPALAPRCECAHPREAGAIDSIWAGPAPRAMAADTPPLGPLQQQVDDHGQQDGEHHRDHDHGEAAHAAAEGTNLCASEPHRSIPYPRRREAALADWPGPVL